jgi:class 3 adenylate cyclase/tetratricopeptide (TPR) repeat protein
VCPGVDQKGVILTPPIPTCQTLSTIFGAQLLTSRSVIGAVINFAVFGHPHLQLTMSASETGRAALQDGPGPRAYVPRLLPGWAAADHGATHRVVDGSLLFFDITGFTPLTERLARRGREGAEELSNLLDTVFSQLLIDAEDEGGDLLKWGGDALLLLFDNADHSRRAARAALRMHRALAQIGRAKTSIGRVKLRASAGIDSGPVHLILAGNPAIHRQLVLLGPTATAVTMLEHAAGMGEVLVGDVTAANLGPGLVRPHEGWGHLLAGIPTPANRPPRPEPEPMPEVVQQLLPPQLRAYLSQPSREPEHRTVAVAFLRFDGTDTLLAEDGEEVLTTAVDEMLRNVQEAAVAHDISFLDTDVDVNGGKILLVGGAPRSAGDDTDRLLTAVCETVDRAGRLPLQAGISQGRVFTGDTGSASRRTYSVKGDAVNLAARLAARAETGSILMAADVLEHTRRSYAVNDAPMASLKGKSKPVPVVTLGKPLEPRRPHNSEDFLIGRDAEMAILRGATEQLINGSGGLIEVIGEPGIGKTRLVDEAVAQAAGNVTVLRCDCERTGAASPYTPVRRLLHQVLGTSSAMDPNAVAKCLQDCVAAAAPELAPWTSLLGVVLDLTIPPSPEVAELEEQHRAERVPELVADLLERMVPSPVMLVVEDSYLADPASEGVLTTIARREQQQPWLLLVTRDDRATGWIPASTGRIELGPLDMRSSIELAEMATPDRPLPPAIAEELAARSGGHPLLLRELARAAARGEDPDELPSSVEELATSQIDQLPPTQRSLLRRAAVLGDEFPEDLLMDMFRDVAPENSGTELLAGLSGLIMSTGHLLRFRHPILREVAYAGLPYKRRRELHAKAAEILETTTAAADRRPEILALHYFVARNYDKAMDYGWRAGERAMARYAPAAAADAYRRAAQAARLSPSVSPNERSFYLEALGDAQFLAGRSTEAAAAYLEALRSVRGQPLREAHLALKQTLLEQRRGHYSNALRRASLGLRSLDGVVSPEAGAIRAGLQVRYAACRVNQGRYTNARQWAEQGLAEAEAANELKAQAQAHAVLHLVEVWSGAPKSEQHGETALRIFEQLGDLTGQAHMLNNLAVRLLAEGRWPDALPMFARAAESFRRIGDATNAANADYNQADVLVRQGRSGEALPLLENSLRVARAVGDEDLVALVGKEMGRAQSRAGHVPAGLQLLHEARAQLAKLREPQEIVDADIATAEAHLLAGSPGMALAVIERALPDAASIRAATLLPSAYRVQAAALLATGDVAQAHTALAEGLRRSSSPDVAHERGFLLAVAARIAHYEQDPRAADLEQEASAALGSLGVVRLPLPEPAN